MLLLLKICALNMFYTQKYIIIIVIYVIVFFLDMKREKISSSEEEGSHKNEADSDAPKRFRGNDENVRLLVPSKVSIY